MELIISSLIIIAALSWHLGEKWGRTKASSEAYERGYEAGQIQGYSVGLKEGREEAEF